MELPGKTRRGRPNLGGWIASGRLVCERNIREKEQDRTKRKRLIRTIDNAYKWEGMQKKKN